jgi:hypothetical protein
MTRQATKDAAIPYEIAASRCLGLVDSGEHKSYLWIITLSCDKRTQDIEFRMGTGHFGWYKITKTRLGQQGGPEGEWVKLGTEPRGSRDQKWYDWAKQQSKCVPIPPSITDVDDCLKLDCQSITDAPTHRSWAEELGYEVDSIKGRDVYFACQKSYDDMRVLLGGKFWEWLRSPNSDQRNEPPVEVDTKSFIDAKIQEARILAIKEVERLARGILRSDASLTEFVMGMGMASFNEVDGNGLILGAGTFSESSSTLAEELDSFLNDYDKHFGLTGTPMRFTKDGPVVTNW